MMAPYLSTGKFGRSNLVILAASNAGSLLTAASLVLSLQPEDRISIKRGCALTFFGLMYFLSLFDLLNAWALCTSAGNQLRTKYNLTQSDVLDINNKAVSAVQALFCVITGVIVCSYSCARDFLHTSHYMSEAYAWFGAAYFFYDIWSMYMVHVYKTCNIDYYFRPRVKRFKTEDAAIGDNTGVKSRPTFLQYCCYEPVILFHHLFIGGYGFLIIVYLRGGLGDCIFGWVYIMELSTPFVSMRGILSRLNLKASRAYLYNGLLMLATFGICRVCSMPIAMLHYSRLINRSYIEAINSLPTGCKISIVILLLPQVYWFVLMCLGAVKVLRQPPAAAPPAALKEKKSS